MKDEIFKEIGRIGVFGVINYNETKRFDDKNFASKENIYQYRISKIKVFLNKNGNILGLQAFYNNLNGEEEAGSEGRDNSIKEYAIKTLEIPSNDFLCNMHIFGGDDYITKLKFVTKKGKELVVGTDEGKYKPVEILNKNKDKVILYLYGGYEDKLQAISCKYLPNNKYLRPTLGFFELRKKLKNKKFKKIIESKLSELDNLNQFIYKICCLPIHVFNKIIKFYILENIY